ncbi:MAG TPA: 2-oxo acid dehydrogenase subunit E2 [Dehalococcoidia bacterium]|nr:2-oxo acid dehydrogenase subunit E2 [Dehalococcoidia bacterium]
MANEIIMPQMGADMTQGKVLRWLKQVGDEIRAGEIIAEIETDKATVEYEAYDSGVLKQIVIGEGQTVPVGTVIAILGAAVEEIPAQPAPTAGAPTAADQGATQKAGAAEQPAAPSAGPPQPAAQTGAGQAGSVEPTQSAVSPAGQPVDSAETAAPGQGEGGESAPTAAGNVGAVDGRDSNPVADQPVAAQQEPISPAGYGRPSISGLDGVGRPAPETDRRATPTPERIFATPIARRLAEEQGIDLRLIQGTGPNGRILKEDIEDYLESRGVAAVTPGRRADQDTAAAPPVPPPQRPAPETQPILTEAAQAPTPAAPSRGPSGGPPYEEIELNRIRQTAARRTQQSKQTAPHFYVTVKVDMGRAVALRRQINEVKDLPTKVSLNDLVIRATVKALQKHPQINASYNEGRLRVYQTINVGIAVGLPDGLINVVLTGAENRSVLDIAMATKDLYERARAGRLRAEEYSGATFTISNLGMYGVEQFAAVISPPEGAILAVASVIREPVVEGDQVRIADVMRLTISADHRVTDGVRATEFLSDLRGFLEDPLGLLL